MASELVARAATGAVACPAPATPTLVLPAPRAATAWWALALGASLALRAPRLCDSLWYDEYCRTSAMLNAGTLGDRLLHDVHHPLYNLLMFLWASAVGDSELSIRLPSLVAGYASLALFCDLLRRRVGAGVARAVGLWGLFAPMHVWYSTEAKNNMFLVAMVMLGFWTTERMVVRPTPGRVAAAGAALVAAFYTDLVAVLAIIPVLLFAVGEARRAASARALRGTLLVALAVGATAVPWLVFRASHLDDLWRGYMEPFRVREAAELLGGMFMTGHAFTPLTPVRTWAAVLVLACLAPLLVRGARALWRPGQRIFVGALVTGLAGMAAASLLVDVLYPGSVHRIYQPRNLLYLLYFFGAILFAGVAQVRRAALRRWVAGALIAAALGASITMQTLSGARFTVDRPRSDWRAVGRAIEADAGGRSAVVVSCAPVMQLERYARWVRVRCTWGARPLPPDLAGGGERLYYIDDRDWWPTRDEDVRAWGEHLEVREVARIDRIVVYALQPR